MYVHYDFAEPSRRPLRRYLELACNIICLNKDLSVCSSSYLGREIMRPLLDSFGEWSKTSKIAIAPQEDIQGHMRGR